jgi:cytochrome b561
VNSADALAGPGLLALLIAIPIGGVLAALGRKGALSALGILTIVVAANLQIANNVSEYGDLGAIFILALAVFNLLSIGIGWLIGVFLRKEARAKRDKVSTGVS